MLADSAFSNLADPVRFRQDLMNIAKTTLSSKILTGDKEHFANLAVDAILRLKGVCREAGGGEGWGNRGLGQRIRWEGVCVELSCRGEGEGRGEG